MITKNSSLVLADRILARVVDQVGDQIDAQVGCFEEGKEQGFEILKDNSSIIFAQDRASESVVVYTGDPKNILAKYDRKVYDEDLAVETIVDYIRLNF